MDKETEDSLAAFLGKVSSGLAGGEAGPGVPDGVSSTINEWMQQL